MDQNQNKDQNQTQKSYPVSIGIDLGTTYSCVGIYSNGKVDIIANEHGNRTTPSYVSFDGTDRYVGESAKDQYVSNPTNTIFDAKRLIGRLYTDEQVQSDLSHYSFEVVSSDTNTPEFVVDYSNTRTKFKPEQISAMILEKMKKIAEDYVGHPITSAVITVPAYFNDAQRQATKISGEIAGLNVLRILNEPTAAAIGYKLNVAVANSDQERNVLIYDLGGGTLDVTVLAMDGSGVLEVKSTSGDTHLGGEDFDNRLSDYCTIEFVKKHFKPKTQLNPSQTTQLIDVFHIDNMMMCYKLPTQTLTNPEFVSKLDIPVSKFISEIVLMRESLDLINKNPKTISKLKKACENAKKVLSINESTIVNIESFYNNLDLKIKISREIFETVCAHEFSRCMGPINIALSGAKLGANNYDKISDVVLIGGSTRIPKIKELLTGLFGNKLRTNINPDEAVAYGASIQAAILSGTHDSICDKITLVDVTPLSIGIETSGGIMSVLVPRNTSVPVQIEQIFSTYTDNQSSVIINIYEGERALVSDNNLLGTFELTDIKPALRGIPKIKVLCSIDSNSILSISASEESSGVKKNIIIKNEHNKLTKEQINQMIAQALTYTENDNKIIQAQKSKISLQTYINHLRKSNLVSITINNKLNEITEWLDSIEELETTPDKKISSEQYDMLKKDIELLVEANPATNPGPELAPNPGQELTPNSTP